MKSVLECLQYASECVQLARTTNDSATRDKLLETATSWRKLAVNAAIREGGAIPEEHRKLRKSN
jgi:hypothetical protein